MKPIFFFICSFLLTFHISTFAKASTSLDIEVDPLAYMLNGHSVHLGLSGDYGRLDLGTFGIEVSEELLNNKGFEASFSGVGLKWDAQKAMDSGLFYGIEGSRNKVDYRHVETGTTITRFESNVGVRTGYRFIVGKTTISPWLGLGKNLDSRTIKVGNDVLESQQITVFPTVHVGYNF